MFFGLTNSLATFQTMMDDIFEDLITKGVVVVYLDDILIFTKTLEKHHNVVRKVLDLLWLHNISLKPEECKFEKTLITLTVSSEVQCTNIKQNKEKNF